MDARRLRILPVVVILALGVGATFAQIQRMMPGRGGPPELDPFAGPMPNFVVRDN